MTVRALQQQITASFKYVVEYNMIDFELQSSTETCDVLDTLVACWNTISNLYYTIGCVIFT